MIGISNLQQQDATFDLTSDEIDLLTQTNSQDWDGWSVQFGIGYPFDLDFDEYFLTTITPAINAYILNDTSSKGQVYRFMDADDNDAHYDLLFNSTRIMLDTAVTLFSLRDMSFYVLAGLGMAWNTIDLSLEPYPHTNLDSLYFSDGTQTTFAYEFGAGLTYALEENIEIAIQYLFTEYADTDISGTSDMFTAENSDLTLNTQTLLIGFNLSV